MKPAYLDPLIPRDETGAKTLRRLALNIATLTRLADGAAHQGLLHVALMFTHSRETKVREAQACIMQMHAAAAMA